jgi:hypothetical protein
MQINNLGVKKPGYIEGAMYSNAKGPPQKYKGSLKKATKDETTKGF